MKLSFKENKLTAILLLSLLVLWLYIAFSVPYTHDDWDWGGDIGMEQWLTGSLNGRYVGNFFVIFMTRSFLFKGLVMGLCMFFTGVLMALLSDKGSFASRLILSNLFIFSLTIKIWRQSVGWVSGFANYGVSACLLLLLLYTVRKCFGANKASVVMCILCALLTCATCLFIENLTVVLLFASVLLLIYSFVKRRHRLLALIISTSAATGSFFMFGVSMYSDLTATGVALGGIRCLSFDINDTFLEILSDITVQFFTQTVWKLFYLSISFSVIMAILTAVCFYRSKTKYLMPLALVFPIFSTLCTKNILTATQIGIFSLVCILIPVFAIISSRDNIAHRLIFYIGAWLMLLPLAVSTEIGNRLYFLTFILISMVCLDISCVLMNKKTVSVFCALALSAQSIWYINAYHQVNISTSLREELIEKASSNNEKTIIFPTERYKVWWGRNPQDLQRAVYFREFYNIPPDVTLVFLPAGSLDTWGKAEPDITADKVMIYPGLSK